MQARPTRRPRYPMPDDIRDALRERALESAYEARPPYQHNDYVGWIGRAKTPETRTKRLEQMLEELTRDDVYMNMPWRPRLEAT